MQFPVSAAMSSKRWSPLISSLLTLFTLRVSFRLSHPYSNKATKKKCSSPFQGAASLRQQCWCFMASEALYFVNNSLFMLMKCIQANRCWLSVYGVNNLYTLCSKDHSMVAAKVSPRIMCKRHTHIKRTKNYFKKKYDVSFNAQLLLNKC